MFTAIISKTLTPALATGKGRVVYDYSVFQDGQPFDGLSKSYDNVTLATIQQIDLVFKTRIVAPMRQKGFTVSGDLANGQVTFANMDRVGAKFLERLALNMLNVLSNWGSQQAQANGKLQGEMPLPASVVAPPMTTTGSGALGLQP